MFGNIMKRLKGTASSIAGSALSADKETVMEAMIASAVLVAYADGTCQNEEVDQVNKLIKSSPQLREFHNEPARLFDNYCDQMEASYMMAKIDLMKKVTAIAGDTENSPRVLISAIEVANASKKKGDKSPISDAEEQVLSDIARELGLMLGKYI